MSLGLRRRGRIWPPRRVRACKDASRFFERGLVGFSVTSSPGRFDGLELQTTADLLRHDFADALAVVTADVGRRIGVLPGGMTTISSRLVGQCAEGPVLPSVSSGNPASVDDPTIPSRAHDPCRLSATRALPVALNERPVVGPDRPLALRPCLVIAGATRAVGGGVRHPPTSRAPGWRS
jgi:hypothetical protein